MDLTADTWRKSLVRPDVSPFFSFYYGRSPFFWEKKRKTNLFPSEIRTTRRQWKNSTCPPYTLVRYTVKTDTTDIQWVDHTVPMQVTKRCKRCERPRKHETNELRDVRVKLYWEEYIWTLLITTVNKYSVTYSILYVTEVRHVRNEEEHTDTYTSPVFMWYAEVMYTGYYILRWYIQIYMHMYLYIHKCVYIHTHVCIYTHIYVYTDTSIY